MMTPKGKLLLIDIEGEKYQHFFMKGEEISSRQPGGCGLSWSELTVIKTDNIIVFQLVIWPVQLNP
ncbi:hypothetical protein OTG65_19430, partial [Escherichia coli]|uniref:hypothetical protein n=1 Tax=Escherichia coli TaxID=562 RepID=UPI002265264B